MSEGKKTKMGKKDLDKGIFVERKAPQFHYYCLNKFFTFWNKCLALMQFFNYFLKVFADCLLFVNLCLIYSIKGKMSDERELEQILGVKLSGTKKSKSESRIIFEKSFSNSLRFGIFQSL